MSAAVHEFYKKIQDRRVYFLGAGISHRELIKRFAEKGAKVTLCDVAERKRLGNFANEAEGLGVTLRLGASYLETLCDADIIFRSPGVDYTKPEIQAAIAAGIQVTSEIETFFALCPAKIVGVTGSDGKTTTTSLIAEILRREGRTVHLGGNIGVPLLPIVEQVVEDDIAVVEMSSFQLISMRQSPDVAVVTNITPNHLDHHKDMREYVDAKRNILRYQKKDSLAVLNADDGLSSAFSADVEGSLRYFSLSDPQGNGAYYRNGGNSLIIALNGKEEVLINSAAVRLPGIHNKANIAAAVAATMSLASHENIRSAVTEFPGVEHRLEVVREKDGVRWINDSIGTSPSRTAAGLKSFPGRLILLAGGYDKKVSYRLLGEDIVQHVKHLFLCGDTATAIEEAVIQCKGYDPDCLKIEKTRDLAQSVERASEIAQNGDIVLMSPASASFDAYDNFEERGRHFKKMVEAL